MHVRYRVTLTSEERNELRSFVHAGKGAFRRLKRAQILLAADAGSTDAAISTNIAVGTSTVYRLLCSFNAYLERDSVARRTECSAGAQC